MTVTAASAATASFVSPRAIASRALAKDSHGSTPASLAPQTSMDWSPKSVSRMESGMTEPLSATIA
jgi:hypothetical protein